MLELITISNTRIERVDENIKMLCTGIKYVYTCKISCFSLDTGVQEEEAEEHGKTVKYYSRSIILVLQDLADFSSISLVFNMFFTLMLVKVKLNMKVKILKFQFIQVEC